MKWKRDGKYLVSHVDNEHSARVGRHYREWGWDLNCGGGDALHAEGFSRRQCDAKETVCRIVEVWTKMGKYQ